jgi:type IV pilus assembly protein PilY1
MKKKIIQVFLLSTFLFINSICKADDTELFIYNGGAANVLLLFNLTDKKNGGNFLDDTKTAVANFLNNAKNINVAIVASEVDNVHGVVPAILSHFKPIETARTELINTINSLSSHSAASIDTDLLLAAWTYFGGKEYYNNKIIVRDTTAQNGNSFVSPIQAECDNNFAFLFTRYVDDYTLADAHVDTTLAPQYTYPTEFNGYSKPSIHKMGWLLGRHDINLNINAEQNVTVFVTAMPNKFVGTTTYDSYRRWDLQQVANYTNGTLYDVDTPQDLVDALSNFRTRVEESSILVSPIITTDAFGFHTQDKKIYFSLFKPERKASWGGNLKCYKLGNDGIIYDKNDNPAIDENTGFFKSTAHSFWSSAVDGNDILKGGIVEHISQDRKVYSDVLDTSYNHYANNSTPLSDPANKLHEDNNLITQELLESQHLWSPVNTRISILKWARGVDTRDINKNSDHTDNRPSIGDSMHTKPLLVKYYNNDETIFLTTNTGFLHAVNPSNGNTIFSFMPRDLLPNIKYGSSNSVYNNKIYGLDAPITSLTLDANGDGNILQSAGGAVSPNEAIFLIMPMRRGGRNIYSLNVSDRDNPKMAWTIRGGKTSIEQTTKLYKSGSTVGLGDFTKLGQTWSIAMPAMVNWQGTPKVVLFFGGGYDEQTDNQTTIQSNSMGNAIFMVDAISGEKLWQASGNSANGTDTVISGMDYSIVANLALVDINQDGFTDFIIATDIGGQVFRIDINNNNIGPASFAIGSVIAKLSDTTLSGSRRFFEATNISLAPNNTHLNIAIGSGFRANPNSTYTQDRVYVIKDKNVFSKPTNYAYANGDAIRTSDLYNATDNLIQSGTASQKLTASNDLKSKYGWYINLEETGEKLLSKLQTYSGVLTFTTYTPPDPLSIAACNPTFGHSNLYALNIENATAVANLTGGSTLGKNDRKKQLKLLVAPEPSIINRGQNGI